MKSTTNTFVSIGLMMILALAGIGMAKANQQDVVLKVGDVAQAHYNEPVHLGVVWSLFR